ncbi:hypothetical protein KK120_19625 [Virgibacillus dakarensis]|nr:hypothetical protein [Virgibacillus dakarensis]
MQLFTKKMFSLNDLKYGWLLLISIVTFTTTFYLDLYYEPSKVQIVALAGYGLAFIIATLWGAFNYIGHVRINVMYQKNNDIYSFVSQLTMSHEEKVELQAYLEDYIQDQVDHGKSKNEATKEAIEQFKIKEFNSLSKNTTLFNLHAHYYLGGFTFIAVIFGLITRLFYLVSPTLFLMVIECTFYVYGVAFVGLFFTYKLIDVVLFKKFKMK